MLLLSISSGSSSSNFAVLGVDKYSSVAKIIVSFPAEKLNPSHIKLSALKEVKRIFIHLIGSDLAIRDVESEPES